MCPDAMQVPTIIDFEASGFGKGSYPIEVGFVMEAGQSWCSLIRPERDWQHWDPAAEHVHHISREILLQHGKSCAFVAQKLNDLLHGCRVYSDGWMFDYVWLSRMFDAAEITPSFQLEDLRCVLSAEQQSLWHVTKSAVEIELHGARHRASTDARVLQLTWLRTAGMDIPKLLNDAGAAVSR